ncbi:MAG: hypothetical protein HY646_22215, partial [Acidobacteria bacterium]|nr:hypothetical protein [Acidobacteriota bacterium]
EQQAQEAIRQFNNQPFKGRPLAVNEARAREATSGPRPAGGGFRPPSAPRPAGPMQRPGAPSFSEPVMEPPARGDRPNRKQFGPDAKPVRSRAQKFKPEGGKKAFKEKFTGQIFGADDDDDSGNDAEIDNFAVGLDSADEEKK